MNGLMGLIVLGTSIWMAVDASQLGYDKRDVKGLAGMGPAGWFFAGILLWIVAFPLYLVKRGELKAAGDQQRRLEAAAQATGRLGPMYYPAMPPPMPLPMYGYGPAVPPQVPTAGLRQDVLDEIVKLDRLRTAGILTDAEFQQKKTELLART